MIKKEPWLKSYGPILGLITLFTAIAIAMVSWSLQTVSQLSGRVSALERKAEPANTQFRAQCEDVVIRGFRKQRIVLRYDLRESLPVLVRIEAVRVKGGSMLNPGIYPPQPSMRWLALFPPSEGTKRGSNRVVWEDIDLDAPSFEGPLALFITLTVFPDGKASENVGQWLDVP